MEPFTITPPDTAPSYPLPEAGPLVRRHPKACIPCRTRKVKCDRQSPCSPCMKSSVTCLFPSPSRTLSRLQQGEIIGNSQSEPEAALLERIRKLESAVKDLGGVVGDEQKSARRTGPQEVGKDDGAEQHQRNEGRIPVRKRRKSGHHDCGRGEGGTSQGREGPSGFVEAVKETGELPVEEDRRWHISTGLLASLDDEVSLPCRCLMFPLVRSRASRWQSANFNTNPSRPSTSKSSSMQTAAPRKVPRHRRRASPRHLPGGVTFPSALAI